MAVVVAAGSPVAREVDGTLTLVPMEDLARGRAAAEVADRIARDRERYAEV